MKRFRGWEPTETHTTTHPDGSQTVTTVTREAEWDLDEQEWMLELRRDEEERCSLCGHPRSVCRNPNVALQENESTCYIKAAQQVMDRQFAERHKDAAPDPDGYLPSDGRIAYITGTPLLNE